MIAKIKKDTKVYFLTYDLYDREGGLKEVLKFKGQDGKIKAVLKDDMSEPEGLEFTDIVSDEDVEIPEGVRSLEEIDEDEELKNA